MSSAAPAAAPAKRELKIVSHCGMFYWWPVWLFGFTMAVFTFIDKHLMVTVPEGTKRAYMRPGREVNAYFDKDKDAEKIDIEGRTILVSPEHKSLNDPRLEMADNKNLGVVFCTILLLVVVITNVPLRGLWSVIVIVIIAALSIILGLLG